MPSRTWRPSAEACDREPKLGPHSAEATVLDTRRKEHWQPTALSDVATGGDLIPHGKTGITAGAGRCVASRDRRDLEDLERLGDPQTLRRGIIQTGKRERRWPIALSLTIGCSTWFPNGIKEGAF